MNTVPQPDSLHRLVKHAIDSGRAQSVTEAEGHVPRLPSCGRDRSYSGGRSRRPSHAVDRGRARPAGIPWAVLSVAGALGTVLSTPLPLGRTLATAVKALGRGDRRRCPRNSDHRDRWRARRSARRLLYSDRGCWLAGRHTADPLELGAGTRTGDAFGGHVVRSAGRQRSVPLCGRRHVNCRPPRAGPVAMAAGGACRLAGWRFRGAALDLSAIAALANRSWTPRTGLPLGTRNPAISPSKGSVFGVAGCRQHHGLDGEHRCAHARRTRRPKEDPGHGCVGRRQRIRNSDL